MPQISNGNRASESLDHCRTPRSSGNRASDSLDQRTSTGIRVRWANTGHHPETERRSRSSELSPTTRSSKRTPPGPELHRRTTPVLVLSTNRAESPSHACMMFSRSRQQFQTRSSADPVFRGAHVILDSAGAVSLHSTIWRNRCPLTTRCPLLIFRHNPGTGPRPTESRVTSTVVARFTCQRTMLRIVLPSCSNDSARESANLSASDCILSTRADGRDLL
jgi:hypothetical protein